jgi:hypothetical protein
MPPVDRPEIDPTSDPSPVKTNRPKRRKNRGNCSHSRGGLRPRQRLRAFRGHARRGCINDGWPSGPMFSGDRHYTARTMRRTGSRWFKTLGRASMSAATLMLMSICAVGCVSNSEGPELLTVSPAEYSKAFDAAVEAARRQGLTAVLRDRRGGIIETNPRVAGSVLEPWRTDNASLDQATENTIAYQRRRARFEFAPAGFAPPDDVAASQPLMGPDMVNAQQPPVDLTRAEGELELRVWVYIERGYIPGLRRSLWTRSKTTQADLVYPEGMTKERKGMTVMWEPFARDPEYERRLLADVQRIMEHVPPASQPVQRVMR